MKIVLVSFILIVATLVSLLLSLLVQKYKSSVIPEGYYSWLPTESAPEPFPVRLIKGDLFFPDGTSLYIPDNRNVHNGWGRSGSTHIVGSEFKPVPVRLELLWFSYTENKFYEGLFDLPVDVMTRLFDTSIENRRVPGLFENFTRIIVGMAPSGHASVWMGAAGETVEIASFQATEVDRPWTDVIDNPEYTRERLIKEVLEEYLTPAQIAEHKRAKPPHDLYASYHERYHWTHHIKIAGTPLFLNVQSFNGENARITPGKGPAIPRDDRPVPSALEVGWIPPGGEPLIVKIKLDESETFAAFQSLLQGDRGKALTLLVQVNTNGATVSLGDGQSTVALKAAHSKVWGYELYKKPE